MVAMPVTMRRAMRAAKSVEELKWGEQHLGSGRRHLSYYKR